MATVAEIFKTMEYGPAPESDKEALAWLGKRDATFGHYIGGAWTKPSKTFDVMNPATGKVFARVADGSKEEVDAAVAAARQALPAWKALSPHARARYLYAIARGVQKHSRLLAVLESMDNGKSIRETRDIDVPLVARHFYHHAGWAQLLDTEFAGYEAIGVVGQIIPWNFPLLMLAWKIAPALEARGIHAAQRDGVRGDRARGLPSRRRREPRERPRRDGRGDRRASGCGQDRLYRVDRGRPHDSQVDRGIGQEALARARRQESLHRL